MDKKQQKKLDKTIDKMLQRKRHQIIITNHITGEQKEVIGYSKNNEISSKTMNTITFENPIPIAQDENYSFTIELNFSKDQENKK